MTKTAFAVRSLFLCTFCVLLPIAANSQTWRILPTATQTSPVDDGADAKKFILDHGKAEVWLENKTRQYVVIRRSVLEEVSCAEIRIRHTQSVIPGEKYGDHDIEFVFDPRRVNASGGTVQTPTFVPTEHLVVRFTCVAERCINRKGGRLEDADQVEDFYFDVDPKRIVKAFEDYQNSCGGALKSKY